MFFKRFFITVLSEGKFVNQGIKITPVSKKYKSLKSIEVHTVLIQTRSFYFGVVIPKSGSFN